ncbi:S1C family serine protease [Amphibiibacter pelophylacis]|uniref:Trypsin-like peptidase domain-containing protein n=1 Tax=Amphibiibacter pelophylacis TaxID=1799477 RepID=A0ACC6P6A1_9BURK
MRKHWLLFSQFVTLLLALVFVIATFKPYWLERSVAPQAQVRTPAGAAPDSLALSARVASPAVVSITASQIDEKSAAASDEWQRFFNDGGDSAESGLGSGVIVDSSGVILTNNHVVENTNDIQVQLADGRRARARIVGTDPDTDLAVLRIDLDKLPTIQWGRPSELAVGDTVLAIGNPFGVGLTVTSGIVSALGRNHLGLSTFENFIQTDAAINPGNSGGALVDGQGQLVGINTAIYSQSGGSLGIGFAISADTARQVLDSIVKTGKVTRGWMGVEPVDPSEVMAKSLNLPWKKGVLIGGVMRGSPAEQAGIQPGDFLQRLGDQAVTDTTSLLDTVARIKPGTSVSVTLLREGQSIELTLTVRARPAQPEGRPDPRQKAPDGQAAPDEPSAEPGSAEDAGPEDSAPDDGGESDGPGTDMPVPESTS